MDTITPEQRSEVMRRVRGKDTGPEMAVRRLVHAMGYRYRLHRRDLAGVPDLTFPSRRKAIFVHGCFWHRHPNCALARIPKSRTDFWLPKLQGNRERDLRNQNTLQLEGWAILVIWECELRDLEAVSSRIRRFLDEGSAEVD